MDKKRIEKEIKKAQKKGIYNPKLKLGIVGLILVIGTIIGTSYAYYTETASNALIINATISKKITVEVKATNGIVNSMSIATAQTDYGTPATFKVTPNDGYQYKSHSCSNADSSYSGTTLTVTPKTSKDVTCKVEFERVRTLQEIAEEIKGQAKSTPPTSDDFKAGCPLSSSDNCSGVYSMADYKNTSGSLDYSNPGGTSYYFRGKVENNYVSFAGKTWRIVRINGDGSIRLVLDGDIGESAFNSSHNQRKYVGYTYDNQTPCTNSNPCQSLDIATNNESAIGSTDNGGTNSDIKKKLEAWYYNNLRNYDSKIALTTFCNDTSYGSGSETGTLYYGPYQRLRTGTVTPQLTCPDPETETGEAASKYHNRRLDGGVYKLKIGLLSADEIVLAGFKPINSSGVTTSNYLYYTNPSNTYFWSSSPRYSGANYATVFNGTLGLRYLNSSFVYNPNGVRPVINLNSNVTVTGIGTEGDPYVIK